MAVLYDHRTPIEMVMFNEFIRYEELDKIIPVEYKNNDYDKTINVYIDLYQFLITIYRYTFIRDPHIVASCIINYAGHIRRYFNTRCNVYAKIALIYSTNDSKLNTRFYNDYNKFYNGRVRSNTRIREIVDMNIRLLKLLIPYFPNVFLRCGTVEPSIMIYDMIKEKLLGVHPNLILSNSQIMYTLPSEFKSVSVIKKDLFPKRYKDDKTKIDRTYAYNGTNCLEYYIYTLKRKRFIDVKFNNKLVCFLMALIGVPKRAINSICSLTTAVRILNQVPLNIEHNIDALCDVYYDYYKSQKTRTRISREYLTNRLMCLDILYQYKLYCELPESKERDFLTQYEDKDSVQYLNNKYFEQCPLHLDDF